MSIYELFRARFESTSDMHLIALSTLNRNNLRDRNHRCPGELAVASIGSSQNSRL